MIRLGDNIMMVERPSELPDVRGLELFEDVETTSFSKSRSGDYPYGGDRICGLSLTQDDDPRIYYVPTRHQGSGAAWNLPLDAVQKWLGVIHSNPKRSWINHNVKFDASFMHFEGVKHAGRLVDTLTLSKMHDTDRMGHGLKSLCKDWLGSTREDLDTVKAYLDGIKSKDYGDAPPDILGRYACTDVRDNRLLYRMLQKERPPEYEKLWDKEIALTSVLLDMELRGFPINRQNVRVELVHTLHKLIDLEDKIARLTGREYKNSSQWMYDYFINALGLPVLMFHDKTGRPTFNKKALRLYEAHSDVRSDPEVHEAVKAIMAFKVDAQYKSLFLEPFLELADSDDIIHPTYNQLVRTSRMSCSGPNIQQQNKRSKLLLCPRPGRCFISVDYSQIEFRLIAHYAQDPDVIRAYNEDPDCDFHKLVASLIYHMEMKDVKKKQRSPAKTMNFGMGFGMGETKCIMSVRSDPLIVEEVTASIAAIGELSGEEKDRMFDEMTTARAKEVYTTYHQRMPGIRRCSEDVKSVCKRRGYVFNAYGRRRHLPTKMARKGFNSIVQGGAMDIIKEKLVETSPRHDQFLADRDILQAANVHDEILFDAPEEFMMDPDVHKHIIDVCENPSVKFRVPIRVGLGVSKKHWAEAADEVTYRDQAGNIIGGKVV